MIFITSYQRPEMLLRLLKELQGENITVIDDGSDYDPAEHEKYCDYIRHKHKGKKDFFRIWQRMFLIARKTNDDEIIFLQDDLTNIDLQGLRKSTPTGKYAFNLMNIGPDRKWTAAGYVDCIFATNRETLGAINWRVPAVSPKRWNNNPNMSSGVGQYLSMMLYLKNIPMIIPNRNYASHGSHESKMHPGERNINPLTAEAGK